MLNRPFFRLVFYFFILFALIYKGNAQTIKGTVFTKSGTVPFANVFIKNKKSINIILKHTISDENGFYEIKIPTNIDTLIVAVTSPGYNSEEKLLVLPLEKKEAIVLNFNLQEKITSLKEVIVLAKEKPITIIGDTTTYNPNSFKDGSEKVIEDLLKKLPGIKVSENGEIRFKGMTIKKMLLDGDDLFSAQYTIGSKNINVDLVDKIQGIEDYHENPLLKGIKDSKEVVLNIKMRKGKTDFSGNIDMGYGITDRYDINSTGLIINKKIKSFGLISYNSIGKNRSNHNLDTEVLSTERLTDNNFYAKELIKQGDFSSAIDNQFSNINNNIYTSFNSLFKISNKVVSRINLGFYSDRNSRITETITNYSDTNSAFEVNQTESAIKKPSYFNANFQLINKNSKKQNWEYIGILNIHKNDFNSITTNNNTTQKNSVNGDSFFTKHNLNYSKLINEKNVFTTSVLYSKSKAPQNYIGTPGTNIYENLLLEIDKNIQKSNFSKEVLFITFDFYGKIKNYNWSVLTGSNYSGTSLLSSLKLFENEVIHQPNNYLNDNFYKSINTFSKFSAKFTKNKYSFEVGLELHYFNLIFENNTTNTLQKKSQFLTLPKLKFLHKITKKSSLFYGYNFNQIAPNETNLFEGLVQTNFRNFINNTSNLDFLKTHHFSLGYNFSNMFNLNRIMLVTNYFLNKNNYFSDFQINTNTTTTNSFLLNSKSDSYVFNLLTVNYIHALKTTIDFDVNYDINYFKNIINNSDLRNVISKNLYLELTIRKKITKTIYSEAKSIFLSTEYDLENSNKNTLNSLNQSFKITFNDNNRFKINSSVNFLLTDLKTNNNYWFLNTDISYQNKSRKIEYNLTGKNLINEKSFNISSKTDYETAIISQNLIRRYVLASISFKF
ncbi:carboxypeptidase-like regulatory domain-containing protein [Flavobacterium solisilvae]|uniref:TonB-dependent receptor n=1 Tax=Flavobacterium solisilvae TaxID=1852019 RepID=A0ABX1QQ65_9FLAO|nr:carboxypeptidase-like regulatory domain-containing protein [Flavobacterium solisilvae]NMH24381.1 hypothetical protein [Flavobacterium solisilvae]